MMNLSMFKGSGVRSSMKKSAGAPVAKRGGTRVKNPNARLQPGIKAKVARPRKTAPKVGRPRKK